MQPKNTKIQKYISFILIISTILPAVLFFGPKKAEAVWWSTVSTDVSTHTNTALKWISNKIDWINADSNVTVAGIEIGNVAKEILRQTAMAVARKALQEATKSTVNWINSGFHGSPLFLENPESFFNDIAKSEVRNLVDIFGYDQLKYPFGKEFALNTINAYKSQLEDNTAYTLSKVMTDPVQIRNYQNDFNVGGWNGFLINTQYPQNNPVGFQMVATEELARRVSGTSQNAAEKIKTTIAQGQGFLSPETCPADINPEYNKVMANAWKRPSFNQAEWEKANPYSSDSESPACKADYTSDLCAQQRKAYDFKYNAKRSGAKTAFDLNNSCLKEDGTSGLVNTTPGSVVADQIKINLGSGVHQKELAAAMGNSLSAVFDALINKFIGDGLNSLASKTNPANEPDNWSYNGLTLGSPAEGGINTTWNTGPEEPIYINKFKKDIEDGIINTEKELQLISEIAYTLSEIWPKARTLDVCLPGPDVGWEQRLEDEKSRQDGKIQKAFSNGSDKQISESEKVKEELKFAIGFLKDWINNKMMTELPSSILYMDAVKDIEILSHESNKLTDARRIKAQGLARLKSIQSALSGIIILDDKGNAIQPEPGSAGERILIQLKKQYDATRVSISNTTNVADRQNDLFVRKEQLSNLDNLITKCTAERKTKGWGTPGGPTSSFSGTSVATSAPTTGLNGLATNSEQAIFCSLPIIGGYSHETFLNSTGITHPDIPLVNGEKVLKYKVMTIKSVLTNPLGGGKKTAYVNIKVSCNTIFNATLLDYKGNLPGLTPVREIIDDLPDDSGEETGTCSYSGVDDNGDPLLPDTDMTQDDCGLNGGSWTKDGEGN
ncbi:hypothetical protein HYW73_03685 [Candidatus Nomurabacteria bacterium]|nr:hypothetical protein [Candidatus Nomurabacteria bacterium]